MVTITLDAIIATENWTCVGLVADAVQQVCVGSLPRDVDSSTGSSPTLELIAIIDCINNRIVCDDWQDDMDRDGVTGVLDLTRLIDLFNGAGVFDSWTGATIEGPCPSE